MNNYQFTDVNNHIHSCSEQLGNAGGQGIVYRTMDQELAIKLVLNPDGSVSDDIKSNERFARLRTLPIPKNTNITIPVAELKDAHGYVMMLLDDMEEFSSAFDTVNSELSSNPWLEEIRTTAPDLADYFAKYIDTGGIRRRVNAYQQAAKILAAIHSRGLVYCDFSARNCFISKVTGQDIVWLIDADNLSFAESIARNTVATEEFAAPEVINGGRFSQWSDCYSYAISFFKDLTCVHPFKGKLMDDSISEDDFADDIDSLAYSGKWPWVLDINDDSNASEDVFVEQSSVVLTPRIRSLFDKTFSEQGRKQRDIRPTMMEWFHATSEALDLLVKCPHCCMYYYEDQEQCPWCEHKVDTFTVQSKRNNAILWKITHEMTLSNEIDIPLRLLQGPHPSISEKSVFKLKCNKDSFEISHLDPLLKWDIFTKSKGTYAPIYGTAIIPFNSLIRAYKNNVAEEVILIEISRNERHSLFN